VIDRDFVSNLPLNGRSFQSLFELAPGVVISRSTFSEQGQFSVNGQRANANYFMVDGVSANIGVSAGAAPGQAAVGSLPALTATGATSNLVSDKLDVKGATQHALYKELSGDGAAFPGDVKWNFGKFLVGRDGKVIKRIEPSVKPESPDLVKAIEAALAAK
jgi:hypothetical protein